MKYSTVIFDFGNVLIHFEPEKMAAAFAKNEQDVELLTQAVFDLDVWRRLDLGTIDDGEVMERARARLPERLHEAAEKLYGGWIDLLPEVEGMRELVLELKERGCSVYVLSNISKGFSKASSRVPIISIFDGAVYSADIGIAKPDERIFAYICKRFGIDPKNAIFIDDNADNIEGAKSFGLDTWHFSFDTGALRGFLLGE